MRAKTFIYLFLVFNFLYLDILGSWVSLHFGTNRPVQTIYIDSLNGKIYIGGEFYEADSTRANAIAVWDGLRWDSVGSGAKYGLYNYAITSYQGLIYSDGFFSTNLYNVSGKFNNGLWDTLGIGVNSHIHQFKEFNGELWASGMFNSAGGDSCLMLAKYDGFNWTCMNFPYIIGGRIEDFIFFNNTLICGGLFQDSTYNNIGISYFNGTQFEVLGHRLYGSIAGVHSMAIFHNELYIAGYFLSSSGNEGNHIMRWDGTAWYDVGGGTDNEIYALKVHNDELYVGGVFEYAGGVYTGNLAKWNGTNWLQVTPSIISPVVYDIQFHNDEIYIGGAFRFIDSIPVNYIAKYSLHTGIEDLQLNNQLSVYPNPSTNKLNIEINSGTIQKISIYDLTGKLIKTISTNTSKQELDISTLSPGLYFLDAVSDQRTFRKRFVKN